MTTVDVECACGWRRSVKAELLGKRIRCRECEKPILVELALTIPTAPPSGAELQPIGKSPVRPNRLRVGTGARSRKPAGAATGGGGAAKWFAGMGTTAVIVALAVGARVAREHDRRAQTTVAATAAWSTHASGPGKFTIDMPDRPKATIEHVDGLTVHGLRLETALGRALFQVKVLTAPMHLELDPDEALGPGLAQDHVSDLSQGAKDVQVTGRRDMSYEGHRAAELTVSLTVDGHPARGRTRYVLVENRRVYEVMVFSADGAVSDADMSRFLDTLQIQ